MTTRIEWGLTPTRWDAFVRRCPQATFFHSPGWYLAQAQAYGYQLDPALVRFSDGTEALLPLATRAAYKALTRLAFAGVENGYGGWVSETPLSSEQAEEGYRLVRARYPNLRITGNPYDAAAALPSGWRGEADETQALSILPSDEQQQLMATSRAKRARKAVRQGFTLEAIENPSEADVARFYELYAAHSANWRYTRWRKDEAYFRALFRHAGDRLVLFLAHHEGQLAGQRIVACDATRALDLYLSTDARFEPIDIGSFMVVAPLSWLHAHGYTLFDFLPSGNLDGVRAFKASYGASPLAFTRGQCNGLFGRSLEALWQLANRRAPLAASPS
ncbi:MAG TPA: GNAT family N-acetyltransferase [Oscillatoriaceae cyanobacterium]